MRIEPMNVVVGIGAGGVDGILEWQDEINNRTELAKMWTTWGRVGLCALGYLGQAFNYFPKFAAPLAQSETTLVTKTVVDLIRSGTTVGSKAVTRPRRRVPVSQTPGTGFAGLETY